jgi:hypothetical protein
MSRFGGVFWFVLVIASGATNFIVKQNVQALDDQLNNVRRQTVAEQKKIHELTADWTYLNQPELLTDLNNRYVHLVQMSPKQVLASIDSIPFRSGLAPSVTASQQMAAASVIAPAATPAAATGAPIVPASTGIPAPPVETPALPSSAAPAPVKPSTTQSVPPARSASLDALFAQVAGDR